MQLLNIHDCGQDSVYESQNPWIWKCNHWINWWFYLHDCINNKQFAYFPLNWPDALLSSKHNLNEIHRFPCKPFFLSFFLLFAKCFLANLIPGLLTIYPEWFNWLSTLLPSFVHPLVGREDDWEDDVSASK